MALVLSGCGGGSHTTETTSYHSHGITVSVPQDWEGSEGANLRLRLPVNVTGAEIWQHSFRAESGGGFGVYGGAEPYLVTDDNVDAMIALIKQQTAQVGRDVGTLERDTVDGQLAIVGEISRGPRPTAPSTTSG